MKKILCIGHASYDITFPFDRYPTENTKNRLTEKIECGGGPASNAAYLLGKWGMDISFIGVLGNDVYGKKIAEEFKGAKVKTNFVEFDNNHQTTLSFIIVNTENGSRTTFTHRSSEMKLKKKLKVKADIILVDGQELEASIDAIKNNPQAISIIDAGSLKEETLTLGKMVNYLVCSKNFAEDYTSIKMDYDNPKSIIDLYTKMEETFKNNIIITLEDKGSLYRTLDKIKIMPSIKVKAIDSTGAGDLYHGAFVYGISQGYDLEKIIRISNITGALSVTKMGGRHSVANIEEVMKIHDDLIK
jgi:sulfofructose kinase